ncbi:MAG: hypothetical protein HYY29_06065 [Chloroflexi bacterium]|nr:hypothetical protein [Chloroflexota bacterium]
MKTRLLAGLISIVLLLTGLTACLQPPAQTATPRPVETATPASPQVTPQPPQATTPRPAQTGTPAPPPGRTAAPPAGDASLEVTDNRVSADFPRALSFKLRAQSSENINRITLSYNVNKITVAPVVNEVRVNFTPSREADVEWVWDQRKGGIPGGAEVSWEWLVDTGGKRIRTEKKTFLYHDPRFDGASLLTVGDVNIYWYDGSAAYGQTLMDAAQDALKRLADDTGSRLTRPVKVYVYPTYEALRSALVFPQEWTGGVAFTEYGIVAIGVATDRASIEFGKKTVAHELGHLVSFQVTFNSYGVGMPTWLNEGLAQYAEGAPDSDRKGRLQLAVRQDKLFSIKSLAGSFPAGTDEALLAYGQADSVVRFLIEKYGKDRMLQYLGLFRKGIAAEEGLKQVYGFDYDGLDAAWRASIGAKARLALGAVPLPVPLLALSGSGAGISPGSFWPGFAGVNG